MVTVSSGVRARSAVAGWLIVAALASVVLAGCTGSGFRYVKSSANATYFKVPKDWKVFDRDQVVGAVSQTEPVDKSSGLKFLAIFDADPHPSLDHDLQTATHPFGLARVRELNLEERDAFSRADLRNEIVPIDDILDQKLGTVDLVTEPKSIVRPKGLAGTRLVYRISTSDGSFTVDQTGLVDPDHRLVYFFIAGCESECYASNRRTITEIADSWTIKEP